MPKSLGLTFDGGRVSWQFPSPWHCLPLWMYASEEADAVLRQTFPGMKPGSERVAGPALYLRPGENGPECILLGRKPETETRLREAGCPAGAWLWSDDERLWRTGDVAAAATLLAHVGLKKCGDVQARRIFRDLAARAGLTPREDGQSHPDPLPFSALQDLTMSDLFAIEDGAVRARGTAAGILQEVHVPTLRLERHADSAGKQRWMFDCSDERRAAPAGFKRVKGVGWVAPSIEVAARLRDDAEPRAELALQSALSAGQAIPIPRDLPLPAPAEHSYTEDQELGILFQMSRRGSLVCDEMGVGKTVEALGYYNAGYASGMLDRDRPSVILAPAFLVPNWEEEAQVWLTGEDMDVGVAVPGKPLPDRRIVLASLDAAGATDLGRALARVPWASAHVDEAHALQNLKSGRTQAVMSMTADRWNLMSGTPIFNRPQGMFPLLHRIAPEIFPDERTFRALYGVTSLTDVDDAKLGNLDALGRILRRGLMIRRLKSDVTDLPPKNREMITVNLDVASRQAILEADGRIFGQLCEVAGLTAGGADAEEEVVERLEALLRKVRVQRPDLMAEITRHQRELERVKIPLAAAMACELLRQGEHPIIFSVFRENADLAARMIRAEGWDVPLVHGGVSPRARQKLVRAFQAGIGDALSCTVQGAGTGLTMTRSRKAINVGLGWTPTFFRQAEDRLHRRTQLHEVDVSYLVVPGTMDNRMGLVMQHKDELSARILGDFLTPEQRRAVVIPFIQPAPDFTPLAA